MTQVAGLSQFGNIRSILGSSGASTVTRHEQLQEIHYNVNFGSVLERMYVIMKLYFVHLPLHPTTVFPMELSVYAL